MNPFCCSSTLERGLHIFSSNELTSIRNRRRHSPLPHVTRYCYTAGNRRWNKFNKIKLNYVKNPKQNADMEDYSVSPGRILFSPQVCFENAALEKLHRRRCRCENSVILPYVYELLCSWMPTKGREIFRGRKGLVFWVPPTHMKGKQERKTPKKPINSWFSHGHYVPRLWYSNFLFHDQAQNLPLFALLSY